MAMRHKIYRMVHIYEGNLVSTIYKWFMIFVIVLSIIPLTMKQESEVFAYIEFFCLFVYVLDYLFRWMTADYKFRDSHWSSFLKYPFRLISLIDLLSILALFYARFDLLVGLGVAEVFAVFRIVRIFRYSKNVRTILEILKRSQKPLTAVGSLAIGYIVISAVIIFRVEPDSFETFFEAVYWATVSLTTVGYGDIYPVTMLGRTVAMLSSFFGIAVVALPSGIVTAEYLASLKKSEDKER